MGRIRQLEPTVINKIAAGEVLERPANAVKELLENSVDALATRIEVDVGQGGNQYIRVVDDGEGIAEDDLPLAVASHATSKIRSADDLFHVHTLGFRGEALASIAAVSDLTIRSRTAQSDSGGELRVRFGQVEPVRPCGTPPGTLVEVRDIFGNTPVRRKFLKSTATEFGHVTEQFARIAIAHPRLHMVLRHNGKPVYDLPATDRLIDRLALFFGRKLAEKLIWVESEVGDTRMWGYVAHPSESKATRKGQYMFLNGRWIQDRALQHALSEAYRGLVMVGRHPIAFLFVELPADQVDVNVHPTKVEVRFRDSQALYRQLLSMLRTQFLKMDLPSPMTVRGSANAERAAARPPQPVSLGEFADRLVGSTQPARVALADALLTRSPEPVDVEPPSAVSVAAEEPQRIPGADPAQPPAPRDFTPPDRALDAADAPPGGPRAAESPPAAASASEDDPSLAALRERPAADAREADTEASATPTAGDAFEGQHGRSQEPSVSAPPGGRPETIASRTSPAARAGMADECVPARDRTRPDDTARDAVAPEAAGGLPDYRAERGTGPQRELRAMQVLNCYLVVETPEGLTLIDQHALHERILYEYLRPRVLEGRLETQRLLVPRVIELSPREAALLVAHRDVLQQVGLGIEEFGNNTVLLTSYPAILKRAKLEQIVRDMAELLEEAGRAPDRRDLLDSLLQMMSCKAAIKAGQRLTEEEIESLLRQRHLIDDAHHCPHGRPTALVLSQTELDRQFGRLG